MDVTEWDVLVWTLCRCLFGSLLKRLSISREWKSQAGCVFHCEAYVFWWHGHDSTHDPYVWFSYFLSLYVNKALIISFPVISQEQEVLVSQSNQILTAIIHGMRQSEPSNHVRLAATTALLNSLEFTRANFDRLVCITVTISFCLYVTRLCWASYVVLCTKSGK